MLFCHVHVKDVLSLKCLLPFVLRLFWLNNKETKCFSVLTESADVVILLKRVPAQIVPVERLRSKCQQIRLIISDSLTVGAGDVNSKHHIYQLLTDDWRRSWWFSCNQNQNSSESRTNQWFSSLIMKSAQIFVLLHDHVYVSNPKVEIHTCIQCR